jgi:hypothetical protein
MKYSGIKKSTCVGMLVVGLMLPATVYGQDLSALQSLLNSSKNTGTTSGTSLENINLNDPDQTKAKLEQLLSQYANTKKSQPNTGSVDDQVMQQVQALEKEKGITGSTSTTRTQVLESTTAEDEKAQGEAWDYFQNNVLPYAKEQSQVNMLIDQYIDLKWKDQIYTDTKSVGDLKMIVRNKYIYPDEKVIFTLVKYLVNKSPLIFQDAKFSWTIKQGDTEIFRLKDSDKLLFYYDFEKIGNYSVEAVVKLKNGEEYRSNIDIEVVPRVNIVYTPTNPKANEKITFTSDLFVPGDSIEWYVDGTLVEKDKTKAAIQGLKGVGAKYVVEYVCRRPDKRLRYYGKVDVYVDSPSVRLVIHNERDSKYIDFQDQITIPDKIDLLIKAETRFFSPTDDLEYFFRVNNQIIDADGAEARIKVEPDQSYRVLVYARSKKTGEQAYEDFSINDFGVMNLSANAGKLTFGDNPFRHRWEYAFVLVVGGLFVLLYNISQGKVFATIKNK